MSPSNVLIQSAGSIGGRILAEFLEDLIAAIPRIVSGAVFLLFAYLVIKVVLTVTRTVLDRVYPDEERLIVDLSVAVVGLFCWFGAALALLTIVGLGEVAASLGTAGGFIGLGVAFALKEMIADTVAGVYLLKDPDFTPGDRVETASVSGTVSEIGLRKTRIRADDGELVVLANRDVEKKWTNRSRTAATTTDGATGTTSSSTE
ncbi:Mechanosensitive ion channel [Halopenitus malekzadehii]|uniref:Mechanosensitive ion channel n=1 Tax=Halopenitus malekzadehii TaxID=1267564 RepID=A0A1H6HUJ1_9EURY|nr:mechanosensitive ion channel domain-containing protein [Halopenitus malekzadehii]SEH37792.1 Mechanosensitive ion channel [Halopenitus malekzadehii]